MEQLSANQRGAVHLLFLHCSPRNRQAICTIELFVHGIKNKSYKFKTNDTEVIVILYIKLLCISIVLVSDAMTFGYNIIIYFISIYFIKSLDIIFLLNIYYSLLDLIFFFLVRTPPIMLSPRILYKRTA